jgi:hypothetical protein
VILDNLNQIQEKLPRELNRNGLVQLCGRRPEWLFENYPERNKDGEIIYSFGVGRVSDAIQYACASKGIFSASERVRGRGAWIDEDGRLILHLGDLVLIGERQESPGLVGEFVYPGAPAIPKPWPTPVRGGIDGVGAELLKNVETWKWRRSKRDPRLIIGWIGAAIVGGALYWRASIWLTGDPGTGKSTLLKMIKGILGRALIASGDATSAGIRQILGFASLPVALDEIEAGENDQQVQQILKLIRNSASGSTALRGGIDHSPTESTLRSSFLANSVLVPAMSRADRGRVTIAELLEMPKDAKPPDLSPARLRDMGAKLLRRMVDQWCRWPETLEMYRAACAKKGLSSRDCDQYGTLLAAADLLIEDSEIHSDFVEELVEELTINDTFDGDEAARDQDRCLQHLLTSLLPPDGPNRRSVSHWVEQAVDGTEAGQRKEGFYNQDSTVDGRKAANDLLGTYGMRIYMENGRSYFAVANSHQALNRLFVGTHWAGHSGKSSVWKQTLMRLNGAHQSEKTVRFDGAATGRATLIPLERVCQPDAPAQQE